MLQKLLSTCLFGYAPTDRGSFASPDDSSASAHSASSAGDKITIRSEAYRVRREPSAFSDAIMDYVRFRRIPADLITRVQRKVWLQKNSLAITQIRRRTHAYEGARRIDLGEIYCENHVPPGYLVTRPARRFAKPLR